MRGLRAAQLLEHVVVIGGITRDNNIRYEVSVDLINYT